MSIWEEILINKKMLTSMSKYQIDHLVEAIKFNTQEILPNTDEALLKEVTNLVNQANLSNEPINHYIGFEISGLVHIGTGIISALKIKKLTEAGIICHIWLANFHTYLNGKLDGKIETINQVCDEYFRPCMIKCLEVVGCDMAKIVVLDAITVYDKPKNGNSFWLYDLDVCKNLTLSRISKSISVTGKKEGDQVEFGVLRYPAMQVADPYFMNIHLVHAGMDQRKCHVLMREIAYKLRPEYQLKINSQSLKPIAMHHSLLLSLSKANAEDLEGSKMSKSKPESAIFVHDNYQEIENKIKKAYCPSIDKELSDEDNLSIQNLNPLLNWSQLMIFPSGKTITIEKLESTQQPKTYSDIESLRGDYMKGEIFPTELKKAIVLVLHKWFLPIYEWSLEKEEIIKKLKNINKS